MKKQKIFGIVLTAIVAIVLIAYAAYILLGIYPDVLITAQDRNIYSGDSLYFSELIGHPFGFFQYIGGYLTQFFFNPAVGACMLIAIWAAIVFAGIKAFKLKGLWRSLMIVPAACLLTSEVDLGYWVYCLPLHGYWFSQSVAILCLLLLVWAANATPRRLRIAWYIVVSFVGFPVFGWISYLFAVCLALSQFVRDSKAKALPSWIDAVGIVVAVIAPLVFRALCYSDLADYEIFTAGFPFFNTSTDSTIRPTIPFFILVGTLIVASFGRVLPALKKVPTSVTCLLVALASSYYVWSAMFKDMNYLYEMKMVQATMVNDWKGVVTVAEQTNTPSRTMVMLKNIALINTGELGERSFQLGNSGLEIYNPDSLNLSIMHIASPLVYYNFGATNYAMRWCMEFSVPYGFSPYYLKNLARCAEVTGEKNLVKRYVDRMHRLTFYKDWMPTPPSPVAKELHAKFPDKLDSDENNCERYVISTFSQAYYKGDPLITEIALFYSMIMRDASLFCPNFYDYVRIKGNNNIPTSYQEAYCLFAERFPDRFPYKVTINPTTAQNYKQFMYEGNESSKYATSEEALGQTLFDNWHGTYWWFNAFGRTTY